MRSGRVGATTMLLVAFEQERSVSVARKTSDLDRRSSCRDLEEELNVDALMHSEYRENEKKVLEGPSTPPCICVSVPACVYV